MADQAVRSWRRDSPADGIPDPEDAGRRIERHRAGTLALIGLSIDERGETADNGDVVVDLDPELIGVAMDSADDLTT